MSYAIAASSVVRQPFRGDDYNERLPQDCLFRGAGSPGPRICTSADQTKVCIQNIGQYGQSHIRVMDAYVKSNERYFMNPLRNSIVIGITNCGKNIMIARQCSPRLGSPGTRGTPRTKILRERGLLLHVHEMSTEIFDGFYLEEYMIAIILTHLGEIFKIDISKCHVNHLSGCSETLMLKKSKSVGESERVQMRLASIDASTNLLWVYVECEDVKHVASKSKGIPSWSSGSTGSDISQSSDSIENRYRSNNPFLCDIVEAVPSGLDPKTRLNYQRKVFIIDITTFDIFSAFTLPTSFGEITKLKTSLVAFCQLANPLSNQFSSRIISIEPTGRYEHLFSFSDAIDFLVDVPDSYKRHETFLNGHDRSADQNLSKINRLFMKLMSSIQKIVIVEKSSECSTNVNEDPAMSYGSLTDYYRSLMIRRTEDFNSSVIQTDFFKDSNHSRGSKSSSDSSTELSVFL